MTFDWLNRVVTSIRQKATAHIIYEGMFEFTYLKFADSSLNLD